MAFALFEENGDLKSGTVLADNGTSLQIELVTGRRAKVKATHVYLRYETPSADALLPQAQAIADDIDVDFLWECAPSDEFDFGSFAGEYFGAEPTAVQSAAVLSRLKASPIYFQRKGRGRFKAAPAETVKAALAAVKKRAEQEARVQAMAEQMLAGELPDAIGAVAAQLLVKPDKMSLEYKAFDRALADAGKSPERLLFDLGAFDSDYALHVARFTADQFARGTGFPDALQRWAPSDELRDRIDALPLSSVQAFSIDDSGTTEIDDALSVHTREDGQVCVGVHIAVPALAVPGDDDIDRVVRDRMSTVYMPGDKITMMPASLVQFFSLDAGSPVPALSLYALLNEQGDGIEQTWTALERIVVADNLRDDQLEDVVTEPALQDSAVALPHGDALRVLWRLMHGLLAEREQVRGKPEPRFRTDFTFQIADGQVQIGQRRRDAPLSRIVAEMMILANSAWGAQLEQAGIAGIYRSQQAGRVRMSSQALPHEGLGVAQYIWSTSPLRRYIDLVNQRQILAMAEQRTPPLQPKSTELFSVIPAFEARHSAYQDFQQRMERYWCIRWLDQQDIRHCTAAVVRDDLVRLADAPLYFRIDGLPDLAPGRLVDIEMTGHDSFDLSVNANFVRLNQADAPPADAPTEHAGAPATGGPA